MKLVTFAIDGCARAGLLEMQPALYPNDRHIVAVATDSRFEADLLVLSLNDEAAIERFVLKTAGLESGVRARALAASLTGYRIEIPID